MNISLFLEDLEKRGVEFQVDGNAIKYRAPKNIITSDALKIISENKQNVISILNGKRGQELSSTVIVPEPEKRYEPFPLTDVQQAYWMGRQNIYDLGNISTYMYIELQGDSINLKKLNEAWNMIVKKHDMLRAIFKPDGFQKILCEVPDYTIERHKIINADDSVVKSKIEDIRMEMSHQVIRADNWPLFDIRALILPNNTTRLCMGFDYLIADAWSYRMIFNEWFELYLNSSAIRPSPDLSFRDCVIYRAQMQKSERYQTAKKYWLDRIENFKPGPQLPLSVDPTSIKKPQFVRYDFKLSKDHWSHLKKKGAYAKLTPTCVLISAFAHVLKKWSKIPIFTINLTLFNRPPIHPDIDQIIGEFTTLNMLNVDFSVQKNFLEKSMEIQNTLMRDLNHIDYSGVEVIRELMARNKDFKSGSIPIVFTSTLRADSNSDSINNNQSQIGEIVYTITQTPQVWIDHQVREENGELYFNWDVVQGLFPDNMIDDMFNTYCSLLEMLSSQSEPWHSSQIVKIPESQQIIRNRTNNTYKYFESQTLHQLFISSSAANPENYAIISGGEKIRYRELDSYARRVAYKLADINIHPGSRIAVLLERDWKYVAAVLGILYSGSAYVPLSWESPDHRLNDIINDSNVAIVITDNRGKNEKKCFQKVAALCFEEISTLKADMTVRLPVTNHDDLAYIIYTSGSTGKPKGVMIDHRGAVNTILDINRRFAVDFNDKVLSLSDFTFDLSVYDMFGAFASGACVVLPDTNKFRNPKHWIELIENYGITLWNSVPALIEILLNSMKNREKLCQSSMRLVLLSGDWIPMDLPDKIKKVFPKASIVSLGGATEASIWSILYPIGKVGPKWKSIPYGKPMTNQQFYIFDEYLEDCPDWVTGELYIAGLGIAKGYWGNGFKTQSNFVVHHKTGESLYRTGDLGRYFPDGNIEFIGRNDSQVKIRGNRIELQEIETVLRNHPAVNEAAVVAYGDAHSYQGLFGYVVPVADCKGKNDLFETMTASIDKKGQIIRVESERIKNQKSIENIEYSDNTLTEYMHNMEKFYRHVLCYAFRKLGIYLTSNESYTINSLMQKAGIVSRYRKWVYRALMALEEMGVIQLKNDYYANPLPLPEISIDNLIKESISESQEHLGYDQEGAELVSKSVQNLPEILKGDMHSAEIYTSDGMLSLYRKTFEYCNSLITMSINSIVKSFPDDKKYRIMEIGAGLGTTTQYVLPALPAEKVLYNFTDISDYFLQKAEKKFKPYSFINYGLFDINQLPQRQGYELHNFDLLIASSVLHATENISNSLENIKSLLSPDGILIILEETKFHGFFDLSMGLQQGFDSFENDPLRESHPLLSVDQWKKVLEDKEFEDTTVLYNPPGSTAESLGLNVIISTGPSKIKKFKSEYLKSFLKNKLPNYMVPSAVSCMERLPLTSNGKIDRQSLSLISMPFSNIKEKEVEPPKTPTEAALVKIWKSILNVTAINVKDSFFDIGGDSLFAIQLISIVQDTFHVELSVQSIIEANNVRELAALIDKNIKLSKFSPIVKLQPKGSSLPFFCVHASDGFVLNYIKLSNFIGDSYPFYGIQSYGVDGKSEPLTQIKMMSEKYIQEIRLVQRTGPYIIGGWSMGAIVAFDMAQRLHKEGNEVRLLVMIDPPIPENWEVVHEKICNNPFERMSIVVSKPNKVLQYIGLSLEEFLTKSNEEQLALFYDGSHFSGQLPSEISFDQFKFFIKAIKINLDAMCKYTPTIYSGSSVAMLKAESKHKLIPSSNIDTYSYWKKFINHNDLILNEIPGDHWSIMLEDKYLSKLAKKLRLMLQNYGQR